MAAERVWDFPRPPAPEPCERRVRVDVGGTVVADSTRAGTFCEFKGVATYLDVVAEDGTVAHRAAWTYRSPSPRYAELRDHVSFYPAASR